MSAICGVLPMYLAARTPYDLVLASIACSDLDMSRLTPPHPLTRASTAQESEPVLTPTDATSGCDFKDGFVQDGRPAIRHERSVGGSSAAGTSAYELPEGLDAIREDGQYDPEAHRAYFSHPINPAFSAPPLTRRGAFSEVNGSSNMWLSSPETCRKQCC